ncbi:type VI secretion system lipoprotein TssJ [Erwinia sp. CGal63]|uniref:type VI secretion system lipoprotein TssJ n=1 Tax=Erwinia sp. CGal63 TaxID=2919889 RepID=UPI00300BAC10
MMHSNKIARLSGLLLILAFFTLAGCSSPFGEKKSPELTIRLEAAEDINLNEKGEPAPLDISFYFLKSLDNFENSDFFTLTDGADPALQAEAKKAYEGILQPGETRIISLSPGKETIALGIVAAYRDIDRAGWSETWELYKKHKKRSWWRKVLPGEAVALTVHFDALAITLDKRD